MLNIFVLFIGIFSVQYGAKQTGLFNLSASGGAQLTEKLALITDKLLSQKVAVIMLNH